MNQNKNSNSTSNPFMLLFAICGAVFLFFLDKWSSNIQLAAWEVILFVGSVPVGAYSLGMWVSGWLAGKEKKK